MTSKRVAAIATGKKGLGSRNLSHIDALSCSNIASIRRGGSLPERNSAEEFSFDRKKHFCYAQNATGIQTRITAAFTNPHVWVGNALQHGVTLELKNVFFSTTLCVTIGMQRGNLKTAPVMEEYESRRSEKGPAKMYAKDLRTLDSFLPSSLLLFTFVCRRCRRYFVQYRVAYSKSMPLGSLILRTLQ